MKKIAVLAFGILLALPRDASPHRLDEYLQATRIAVAREHVALEIDLTPGVAIAPRVFALVDRDADGRVTELEIEAYARTVLEDVALSVDGRTYRLTLTRAESPSWSDMRDGLGTIRIEAAAAVPLAAGGKHHIRYQNFHQPEISVYLANALVPASREVSIAGQDRDREQRRFDLDIAVSGGSSAYSWLAVQGLLFVALLIYRAR
jgi:hypothetical protein